MANIDVPAKDDYRHIRIYLEILSPVSKLTTRENDVLASILHRRWMLVSDGQMQEGRALDEYMSSPLAMRELRETLGMSAAALSNILASLKRKRAIRKDKDVYVVSDKLNVNPQKNTSLNFRFVKL